MSSLTPNTYLRFEDNVLYDIVIKDFEINYQLTDIKNFSESKTSFSVPIKIPYTDEAVKIFGILFNVNSLSAIIDQKVDVKLIYKNKVIINGNLYIDNMDFEYIYVIISRADLNIFESITDLNLSDLNFTGSSYSYNQKTRRTRVAEELSFDPTDDNDYKDHHWVSIDWWDVGNNYYQILGAGRHYLDSSLAVARYNDLKLSYQHTPVIRVKTIFDKIFIEQGYTYSASTSFLDKIDKLYMTTTAPIENFSDDVESRYFFRENGSSTTNPINTYTGIYGNSGNTYAYMREWSGTDPDAKGVSTIFNYPSNRDYTFSNRLMPSWRPNQEIEIELKLYGNYITGSTGSVDITLQGFGIDDNIKEEYIDYVKLESILFTGSSSTFYKNTTKFTPEYPLTINNECRVKIEINNGIVKSSTATSLLDAGIVFKTKNYIYQTGTTYTLNNLLSETYSQTDFLKDLINAFNIYIYVDESDKNHLNLLTHDDFYTEDILDWSDKFSIDNINISDTSKKLYNEYLFSNSLGSDAINSSFDNNIGKILGQEKIINSNDLAIGQTETIEMSTPRIVFNNNYVLPFNGGSINLYGSTVFTDIPTLPIGTYINTYNSSIMFGYLNRFNLGIDGTYAKIYNNYAVDGEYSNNLFEQTHINSDEKEFNLFTLSPYRLTNSTFNPQELANADTFAFSYNSADTFANSLTGGIITNNNLYNNFWFNSTNNKLFTQQKFLKTRMYLNEMDVNIENFRKKIWIENDKLGSAYYHINKIVFPSDDSKLSKVELTSVVPLYQTYSGLTAVNLYQYNSSTESVSLL